MIPLSSLPGNGAGYFRFASVPALLCFLVIGLVAASSGSFWIDEFVTAKYAAWPNFIESWKDMVRIQTAEVQMPFYMGYVWAYEKLFGTGERLLRLASLPWFLCGMVALNSALRRRGCGQLSCIVVFGFSPFAWYYLNEARLYAMQLGVVALMAAALFRLSENPRPAGRSEPFWLAVYGASVVVLSGISLLGMIWASAGILAAGVLFSRERLAGWWRRYRLPCFATALVLLVLGLYYLWSVKSGARATSVATTTWQTIIFVFYEALGFAGVGPGRGDLRDVGAQSLKPYLPWLLGYAAMSGCVLFQGIRTVWGANSRGTVLRLSCCLLLPVTFLLATGVLMHFRVLGRHFAPLVIVILLLLCFGCDDLWQRRRLGGKALAVGFLALTMFSCLSLRFASRHAKDDYRAAAALAKGALESGETVWWNAEEIGARYYGLAVVRDTPTPGFATCFINPGEGFADALTRPHMIIASKPDIYDSHGTLAAYLAEGQYRPHASLPAFIIWRRHEN